MHALTRAAIFSGALLLFLIQPIVARILLPVLGGSAQVWNTCVVFFQLVLVSGYGYAYVSSRFLRPRAQVIVQSLLMITACASLYFAGFSALGPAAGASPVVWILRALIVTVGLPVFTLAAAGPLIQNWFSKSGREGAEDPYFLFAASNAGSLAALIAYPLLLDPFTVMMTQFRFFSGSYVAAAVLILLAGAGLSRRDRRGRPEPATAIEPEADAVPRFRWLCLAFVPASLMLGVTAHMANEVPSIPLLWVLPLIVYLLSFILVFARRQLITQETAAAVAPILIGVLAIVLFVPLRVSGFSLHLGAFFFTALVLHGELSRLRPRPGRLTEYYLWIAAGGALGGVFNALVAPAVFPVVAEYPIAIVLACFLLPGQKDVRTTLWSRRLDWAAPAALTFVTLTAIRLLPHWGDARDIIIGVGVLFMASIAAVSFRRRPLRFALGIAAVLLGGFSAFRLPGAERMARSYYGTYRVVRAPDSSRFLLFHGTTIHGAQDHAAPAASPISYFYPESPVGRLMTDQTKEDARIGVIGLGVGALAWYVRPGQTLRYFEIDPLVYELAGEEEFFTYLSSARGKVDVVLEDGRLAMEREPDGSFDLIIADAFSSDAVPVHLLTREAVSIYREKLAAGGALLFNTSNRHVRLDAVAAAVGRALGMAVSVCKRPPLSREERSEGKTRASWLLMARSGPDLQRWTGSDGCWGALEEGKKVPVWTDAYTSLLPAIRW